MKCKSKPGNAMEDASLSKRLPDDYAWKVLGWLTDDLSEYIGEEDSSRVYRIVRSRNVEALYLLADEWGLQCISRCPDGELMKISARYQLAALLKKFRFSDSDKTSRLDAAKKTFFDGESSCRAFNLGGYKALSENPDPWMQSVFKHMKTFMQRLLGLEILSFGQLTDRSRHGPGATTGTETGRVSSYFKYEKWPYHCTVRTARMARLIIESDDRWIGALENDYRERFSIPKHVILDQGIFWSRVIKIVDGNRIAFVPKNARTERSIAIEPTINLFLQLGVDGFIRRRLKRWNVNLDSQDRNQELARLGSCTDQLDPFVTIDLANASGTIARKLCKLISPQDWYDFLCDLRSPYGNLDGSRIEFEMMSSMGNGFTFALESAIFTAVIYAVMMVDLGHFAREEFAVFGDDLIVRQSLASHVIDVLTSCGFSVNEEKSFLTGCVRESCGTDWYQGKPIRPVFLEETPKVVDELFCDLNRLRRNLQLRFNLEEGKVLSFISKWIPKRFQELKGPFSDEDFSSYIHWPRPISPFKGWVYGYCRIVRKRVKTGGNKFLFRKLMHDLHPIPVPVSKWDADGQLVGSGSRFEISLRGRFTLSLNLSTVSHWQSEYTPL